MSDASFLPQFHPIPAARTVHSVLVASKLPSASQNHSPHPVCDVEVFEDAANHPNPVIVFAASCFTLPRNKRDGAECVISTNPAARRFTRRTAWSPRHIHSRRQKHFGFCAMEATQLTLQLQVLFFLADANHI